MREDVKIEYEATVSVLNLRIHLNMLKQPKMNLKLFLTINNILSPYHAEYGIRYIFS